MNDFDIKLEQLENILKGYLQISGKTKNELIINLTGYSLEHIKTYTRYSLIIKALAKLKKLLAHKYKWGVLVTTGELVEWTKQELDEIRRKGIEDFNNYSLPQYRGDKSETYGT